MAVRLIILKRNLFVHYSLPQNLFMKMNFHLGNCLKFQISQPKLLNIITREFKVPFNKEVKIRKTPANDGNIIYRVATVDDGPEIINFLRESFYPDEPLTMGENEKFENTTNEEHKLSLLPNGTSAVAIDSVENKIVGVVMTDKFTSSSTERKLQAAARLKDINSHYAKVLTLLAHMAKEANVLERYKVEKALDYYTVAVDKGYRGNDMTVKMVRFTENNARSLGYPLEVAICTSFYTIQLCKQFKWDHILNIKHSDYKDSNGNQVFNPPALHEQVALYAKVIN